MKAVLMLSLLALAAPAAAEDPCKPLGSCPVEIAVDEMALPLFVRGAMGPPPLPYSWEDLVVERRPETGTLFPWAVPVIARRPPGPKTWWTAEELGRHYDRWYALMSPPPVVKVPGEFDAEAVNTMMREYVAKHP